MKGIERVGNGLVVLKGFFSGEWEGIVCFVWSDNWELDMSLDIIVDVYMLDNYFIFINVVELVEFKGSFREKGKGEFWIVDYFELIKSKCFSMS